MLDRSDLPFLILAIFLALGLQAGLAILFFDAPDIGARAPGAGGMEVAIIMVAARQQIEQIQAGPPDQNDRDPAADPVPENLPQREETIDTVTETVPEPAKPDTVVATPEPAHPSEPEPVQPPQPVEADLPKPEPAVSNATFPHPVEKPVRTKPKKTEAPIPPKKQEAVPEAAEPSAKANIATAGISAQPRKKAGEGGTHAKAAMAQEGGEGEATDRANQEGGQAVVGDDSDYAYRVRLWLERHKVYPKQARRKRKQGIATLYFRVSRTGQVLAQEIRQGSGHEILDREVLAMLKRAQPLPPLPDDIKGAYADMIIPIDFSLRGNR